MNLMTTLTLLLLITGCGSTVDIPPFKAPIRQLDQRIDFNFSTRIPNPYVVRSGPIFETNQSYHVNGRFQQTLADYLALKSNSSSSEQLVLRLTLKELQTTYHSLGAKPKLPKKRIYLAANLAASRVNLASSDSEGYEGGNFEGPFEITKSATVVVDIELFKEEKLLASKELSIRYAKTLEWDDMGFQAWAYDYDPIFRGLIAKTIDQIDQLLDSSLPL